MVLPKSHLTFFRGYLSDLIAAVKKAAADGALAGRDEQGRRRPARAEVRARHVQVPLGQYRDRVGTNVEMVYRKVVKKA